MSSAVEGHTLALEASTYAGSVAVIRDADVVVSRDVEMRGRDEERLMPAVAECISELPGGIGSIRRVVCGAGPGSFTSLRIAASIAKGICHARDIPLFQVSSLALILAGSASASRTGRYVVSLDAMRGESFVAVVEIGADGGIPAAMPFRISAESAASAAGSAGAAVIQGAPHAAGVARMLQSIIRAGPVDVATWEPDYGRAAEAQVKWEAAHGRPLPR
jgi:tRNA threonylcarbamoyladenosine biosynthesis protein TsaB